MVRIALLMVLLAAVRPADACPPGPCNKYRPNLSVPAHVTGYTRRIDSTRMPRFTRARITAFLTGSIWDPVYALSPDPRMGVSPPPAIRFVEARSATRRPVPIGTRTVLVRRIEVRDGEAMIEVDGQVFVLERCDHDLPGGCLALRTDLSFDEPQEQSQFAKPPR